MRVRHVGRWLYALPILIYRELLSPLLPRSCIYTPSCSAYAHAAILRHGVIRGTILAATRVSRCMGGLFRGGEDPVPVVFSFVAIRRAYRTYWRGRGTGLQDSPPGDTMGPTEGRHEGTG